MVSVRCFDHPRELFSCCAAVPCMTENLKVNLPINKWETDQTSFI